jgi:hypothetical protein
MKTILFIIMMAAISLTACKKSSSSASSSAFYIKATINGTNVVYNNYTGAINKSVGSLTINGYNSDAITTADGISLAINIDDTAYYNDIPVAAGVYTDTANYLRGIYNYLNPYNANITLQQAGTAYVNEFVFDTASATPFTCTITAIDSASVSGTFSGIVYYGDDPQTSIAKTITNGSFHVPF